MRLPNKRLLLATATVLSLLPAWGQKKAGNVLDLKYSIEDSSIVYPESFETGTQKLMERWYLKNYTSSDPDATSDYDPGATDDELRSRLAALPTVIDMPFNGIVKSYIERYTKKGRKQVTALLGLSSYYMPIFEQSLEEAVLPLELKYLPVIESALDPCANSRHGAAGLWQFMLASAKGYGMEVSSVVDERRDPYVSSEKACQYLKDLYESYGDWILAIASYNCGPGTVNKALARAGGVASDLDFWSIYYYLPEETRGYVPLFIAANYIMNYYPEHNISPVLATKPLITDTIHLTDRVHFNQIAAVLDIPVEEIRILNPQFRADIIPGSPAHPYNLILPSQQTHAFLVSQDQIMAYESEKYARKIDAEPGGEPLNPADLAPVEEAAAELAYEQVHPEIVEAEEPLTPRRRRNEQAVQTAPTTTQDTAEKKTEKKAETAPKKTEIAAGKTESASKKSETASKKTKTETAQASPKKSAKTTVHSVASGENLSVIAKKYGVTVSQLQKANPNIKPDVLHPGDKLNIPSKSGSAASSSSKKSSKKKKR